MIVNAKAITSLAVAGSGDIHASALTAKRLSVDVSIVGSGSVRRLGAAPA